MEGEEEPEVEAKVQKEEIDDAFTVASSGDEESVASDSSSSSVSSTSSPSRKRIALEQQEGEDFENFEASKQPNQQQPLSKSPSGNPTLVSANEIPLHPGYCAGSILTPRSLFVPLESVGSGKHHIHGPHQPRRRSVLASISPPPTLTESASSPID